MSVIKMASGQAARESGYAGMGLNIKNSGESIIHLLKALRIGLILIS